MHKGESIDRLFLDNRDVNFPPSKASPRPAPPLEGRQVIDTVRDSYSQNNKFHRLCFNSSAERS